jgi:hypothetical protein
VNNEWIMDAVTHQPLGKQAAMKGADGVFYWDLNVKQAITPMGQQPPKTQFVGNMRKSYKEWHAGMSEQWNTLSENNPTMTSLINSRTAYLVNVSKPTNLDNWKRAHRARPEASPRHVVARGPLRRPRGLCPRRPHDKGARGGDAQARRVGGPGAHQGRGAHGALVGPAQQARPHQARLDLPRSRQRRRPRAPQIVRANPNLLP